MPPFALRAREPGRIEARLMIQAAFEDLRAVVSPAHTSEFASTTLQDVREAAIEVERELAGRQLLRNTRRLDALFRGLEHYSSVVGILCAGTDHLPWIWAPVKLVLKMSSGCIVAFESLVKAYAQIAEHLGRFEHLRPCFKDNPEFHPTFAAFYVGILAFHRIAYKFVTRRCWKDMFATSWSRSKQRLNNVLEDLRRHGDIIDEIADARTTEARDMGHELQSWKEVTLHRLVQSEKEQSECHLESITAWLGVDDADQVSLRDPLVDVGIEHPGTTDWILKRQDVISWLQPNTKTPFLLLQGGPGTGKSVLSARVVRSLQDSGRSTVLSHFCSYSPSATARYDVMVKSLLLGCVKADHDLAAHIYDENVTAKQASISLLEKLLETAVEIIGDNKAVHIILDGVDECLAETQRKIFRLVDRLITNGLVCKVLVSGRSSMAVPHAKLRKAASTVSLSEEKDCVGEAIRNFVTTALRNMHRKLSEMGLPDQSVPELASRIVAKADGMFLWARLILNYLDANFFYNKAEFDMAIEAIPQELSQFYEKILSHVLSRCDSRSVNRLKGIFGWIAFAKRPLQISELQSALLFDATSNLADRPVPNYVLESCGPLVERRKDSTICFIHVSVKEYLQRDDCVEAVRLSQQASLWDNGLSSLRCLRRAFEVFGPSTPELARNIQVLRGVWAFLPYTRDTWFSELREMASVPRQEWNPLFWDVAQQLSHVLTASRPGHSTIQIVASIPGLDAIRSLEGLWSEAAASLVAESKGEILATGANDSDCFRQPQSIQDIHANYEWVIQQLISISHHPDINASELDHFRENLTRGAYACRFPLCDAATSKFRSISERAAHEATHAPTFPCLEPGCQYPPFTSGKSLRRHQSEFHESGAPRNVNRDLLMKQVRPASTRDHVKAKPVPRSPGDANRPPTHGDGADETTQRARLSVLSDVEGPADSQEQRTPPAAGYTSDSRSPAERLDDSIRGFRLDHIKQEDDGQGSSATPIGEALENRMETTTGPSTPHFEISPPMLPTRQQQSQQQNQQLEPQFDIPDLGIDAPQPRHIIQTPSQPLQQEPQQKEPPTSQNHALADYQRQVMLVEQASRKRKQRQKEQQQPPEPSKLEPYQLQLELLEKQKSKLVAQGYEKHLNFMSAQEEQQQRKQPQGQVMAGQTQDDRPMYRPEEISSFKSISGAFKEKWEECIIALRRHWRVFDTAPEGTIQKRRAKEQIQAFSFRLQGLAQAAQAQAAQAQVAQAVAQAQAQQAQAQAQRQAKDTARGWQQQQQQQRRAKQVAHLMRTRPSIYEPETIFSLGCLTPGERGGLAEELRGLWDRFWATTKGSAARGAAEMAIQVFGVRLEIKLHDPPDPTGLTCGICGERYATRWGLRSHVDSYAAGNRCRVVGCRTGSLSDADDMIQHLRNTHLVIDALYKCRQHPCAKSLALWHGLDGLREHLAREHKLPYIHHKYLEHYLFASRESPLLDSATPVSDPPLSVPPLGNAGEGYTGPNKSRSALQEYEMRREAVAALGAGGENRLGDEEKDGAIQATQPPCQPAQNESRNMSAFSPHDVLLQEPFASAPQSTDLIALTSPSIDHEFDLDPSSNAPDSGAAWYPLFPEARDNTSNSNAAPQAAAQDPAPRPQQTQLPPAPTAGGPRPALAAASDLFAQRLQAANSQHMSPATMEMPNDGIHLQDVAPLYIGPMAVYSPHSPSVQKEGSQAKEGPRGLNDAEAGLQHQGRAQWANQNPGDARQNGEPWPQERPAAATSAMGPQPNPAPLPPKIAGLPPSVLANISFQMLQPNQDEINAIRNHPRMVGAPLDMAVNLARQVKIREYVKMLQAQQTLRAPTQQQPGQGQQAPPPTADGQTPVQAGQSQSPAQRPAVPASGIGGGVH